MTNRWRRDQELVGLRRSIAVFAKRIAELERQVAKSEELAEARAAVAGAVLAVGEKVERRLAALEALRPAPPRAVRRVPAAAAARRLGVSPATVRRRIADGTLDGIVVEAAGRKRWAVGEEALERLEHGAPGAPGARNGAAAGPGGGPEEG